MTRRGLVIRGALAVLGLATLSSTFYTVSEQEQVVITQFGEPIGQAVASPGLHVKIPFTQDVNVFDKRWLEWNGSPNQVPTRDKKYIWVETYARWRIADPLLFFQRLRDERGAQSRLDDIIDGETRNVIASHNLIEVVRVSNRAFEAAEEAEDVMEAETMRQVELGRDKITRLILERASKVMPDYGIELVDVQIQRINYIETVQAKVFDRMISERKRIADRYRSEGQGKSAEIRGKKERELKVIESEAYKKTQEVMGGGDAQATAIYAAAAAGINVTRNPAHASDLVVIAAAPDERVLPTALETGRPEHTVGLHLGASGLAELIRTRLTSGPAAAAGLAFADRLGLQAVQAPDRPGFLVGALLYPHLADAVRMVQDGYASPADVDTAMTLGCGYPAGPFQLLDKTGPQVVLDGLRAMHAAYGDPAFAPPPLLAEHAAAALGFAG